jgi:class 3 adenylate cyclase
MALLDRLNLSVQSKLMVILLVVAVTCIGGISWISYSTSKTALTGAAFNQLTSVRASKKIQIEAFFKTIRFQVSNLANDRMIVDAARELTGGFAQFKNRKLDPDRERRLEAFYRDEFVPRLARGTGEKPRLEAYLPAGAAARYAQFLYVAGNSYPNERSKLRDAGDGSEYSKSHARYQPIVTKFMLDFGYDNMILADSTGDVVYTFSKSAEFGTNLLDGPYSDTALANLFRKIRAAGEHRRVQVVDFASAPYSYGKPVALMGAPVFDGDDEIGVLFVQFPTDEINRVMTDNFGWAEDGLGKTGEVYLVGPDFLMRSRSRLLHEDPRRYFDALEKANYPPDDIARVRRSGTATLSQPAHTKAVEGALAGTTGTSLLPNYLHTSTLSSFSPLSIPGLQWVIVAEMESSEAFAPLIALTRRLMIWSLIAVLGVTVLAAFFGRRFVRPIFRLVEGINRLKAGERDVTIDSGSKDEFEDLGRAFDRITRQIVVLGDKVAGATRERDELIDNVLPAAAAARMKAGLPAETDEYPEVSVVFAHLAFGGESNLMKGVEKSLDLLNDLTLALDDAAERRGLRKLAADGTSYVAVCGLSRQRLDHASRSIDFAQDTLRIVQRLHRDRLADLSVRIGIDAGGAAGGVSEGKRFGYRLAGTPMALAGALAAQAPGNSILVSRQIYASTQTLYAYGPPMQIVPLSGESATAWPLQSGDIRPARVKPPEPAGEHSVEPEFSSSSQQPQGVRNA